MRTSNDSGCAEKIISLRVKALGRRFGPSTGAEHAGSRCYFYRALAFRRMPKTNSETLNRPSRLEPPSVENQIDLSRLLQSGQWGSRIE